MEDLKSEIPKPPLQFLVEFCRTVAHISCSKKITVSLQYSIFHWLWFNHLFCWWLFVIDLCNFFSIIFVCVWVLFYFVSRIIGVPARLCSAFDACCEYPISTPSNTTADGVHKQTTVAVQYIDRFDRQGIIPVRWKVADNLLHCVAILLQLQVTFGNTDSPFEPVKKNQFEFKVCTIFYTGMNQYFQIACETGC